MENKKVLRSSKVLAGEAERTGWILGPSRRQASFAPIHQSNTYRIMLMVSWVTVLKVVTDFALAS